MRNDSALSRRSAEMLKAGIGKDGIFVLASEPGGNASEDYPNSSMQAWRRFSSELAGSTRRC